MQTLRMLGSIGLASSDGADVDALLRQPKSVALLAYLATPRPGSWHRRDVLLATFWPELSQTRARAALRSALHLLRRHLDDGTIRTRGDDEVALDAERLTTDVAAMLDDVAARAHDRAVARYAGPLLPGLYISEAPEFERWLERERARLNDLAVRSAAVLVDEREAAGNLAGATEAARRASELSPDDEGVMRRYVALLDRIGDRVGALAVFERFRARISQEFGSDPSAATLALIADLRTRAASRPAEDTTAAAPIVEPPLKAPPAEPLAPELRVLAPRGKRSRHTSRRSLVALGVGAVALFAAGYAARHGVGELTATADASRTVRLVLLPVETGRADSSQRYLATGIGIGVARRLERLGGLSIRTGPRATWPASPVSDTSALERFGATVALRVTLAPVGDSLDVNASLADSASHAVREVLVRRFATSDIAEIESAVAAAAAGVIHRVSAPFDPHTPRRVANPESYRLTILGFHQLLVLRDSPGALASFVRATELDPLNARAWAGLSSVWASRIAFDQIDQDEGSARVSSAAQRALAIDSTEGTALANLGVVRVFDRRNLAAGMPLVRRAIANEPSNAEIFLIASYLERHAHRWDEARDLIRVARTLDPLTARFAVGEGVLEVCTGRRAASERIFRGTLEETPREPAATEGLIRSLSAQGRFDEALEVWRESLDSTFPPASSAALAGARGRSSYLAALHERGRAQLEAYRRTITGKRVGTLRLAELLFDAGDTTAGFATLDAAVNARAIWTYLLPCFSWLDEVRETPHYRALLSRAGAMPAR